MNRGAFYASLRKRDSGLFGTSLSQNQVNRVEAVLDGLVDRGIRLHRSAYILGTAYHESDRFKTLEEYASGAAYEGRRDLGNTQSGDGKRFKGRGLVQITGRRNYSDWSDRLGTSLVDRPELAADLRYAVPILIDGMMLGTFTGRAVPDYIDTLDESDDEDLREFANARRTVNGTDRAALIGRHALAFERALKAGEYYIAPDAPEALPADPKDRNAHLQRLLEAAGFELGRIDGIVGPRTRAAIKDYQRANGLTASSSFDTATVRHLMAQCEKAA